MKVWELKEGKEYKNENDIRYKKIGNEMYYFDIDDSYWKFSKLTYNKIIRYNFEEIQHPMTFQEAMEWMMKDIDNICQYKNSKYKIDVRGELCKWILGIGWRKIDRFNIRMYSGEWYKG